MDRLHFAADRDDALAAVPPSRPPGHFGMTPRTLEEAWRFAQMLAGSDLVPKAYQGKPENVIVAMQYGAEVGLSPMAALQSVAVINGKPGLYGDGFLAVIIGSPAYADHREFYLVNGERRDRVTPAELTKDDTAAVAEFWRRGRPEPFVAAFSIADAKKARLLGKDGPWSDYPARMLRWRAREFAGRDAFAAELRGMGMAEALRDAEIIDAAPPAALQPPTRRSSTPPVPVTPEPPAEEPTPPEAADLQPATPATPAAAPLPLDDPPAAAPERKGRLAVASGSSAQVVIEGTQYVQRGPQDTFHYEVTALQAGSARIPIGHTFVTADEALYKLAVSCEGTGTVLVATWHRGSLGAGPLVKLLDSLAAAD